MKLVKTLAPVVLLVAVCALPAQAEESADNLLAKRINATARDDIRTAELSTGRDATSSESVDCFYADNAHLSVCKVEERRVR